MCTCVKAIENARDAALPSRYFRASASAGDRIEHGPGRPRERPSLERCRLRRRSSAAEEARAIGFPFDRAAQPSFDAEHVERPARGLVRTPRPPAEQQPRALRVELCFHEELRERRVGEIVLGRRQHDFGVARDLDLPRAIAAVHDRQPPYFHVVFGRNRDLQLGVEIAVAGSNRHLVQVEDRIVAVRFVADRLKGRRPDEP
jgi:hypothetical protein